MSETKTFATTGTGKLQSMNSVRVKNRRRQMRTNPRDVTENEAAAPPRAACAPSVNAPAHKCHERQLL